MRARRRGRLLCCSLVAALLAGACSGGDDTDDGSATTTSSPTTTSTADTTPSSSVPEADVYPLTGEPLADAPPDRPAVVVKIGNNDDRARPQAGLADADIVYEELIEGLKTRLAAVFQSEIPDRIGPVRSGRTSDIDLLFDLGQPLFAYSGANATVLDELRTASGEGVFVDIGILAQDEPYYRDDERAAPDNLYLEFSEVESPEGGVPGPLFAHGSSPVDGIDDAVGVTVRYPTSFGRESTHVWDEAVDGWVRIQDGTVHTTERDGTEVEIAPANVVVASIDYVRAAADLESPQGVSIGSGEALILTRGKVIEGRWSRGAGADGWSLTTADGDEIELSPGSTWILLANRSTEPFGTAEISVLDADAGAEMLAAAREEPTGN